MKTRRGFISNSSTSSFVLLMTSEIHEGVMASLKPWEEDFVCQLIGKLGNRFTVEEFVGQECVKISFMGCSHSDPPQEIHRLPRGTKETTRIPEPFHHEGCSNYGKQVDSKHCSGCGTEQEYTYYINTPADAWQSYIARIRELAKDPDLQNKIFISEMFD